MKTLSYIVIMLFAFAVPVRAAQVYSGCATPPSTFRHVWYFDPVHGKTQAAGGNGSQAAPWNNLQALVQARAWLCFPASDDRPLSSGSGRREACGHDHRPEGRPDRALAMKSCS